MVSTLLCSGMAVPRRRRSRSVALLLCLPCISYGQASPPSKLADLSLEQLMQIEVTTVSKHPEKITSAPAAVYVLTSDDLRRAGSPNLAEALRLIPGLQVSRVDSHDWAISARGFADVFATKLLVLQDGRSVYTPLFSGVFWDIQDTLLADVERIEVVRGPGATLWGANAVNGVINILSKPAAETQGTLVEAGGGSDPEAQFAARYGGAIDAKTHYRVYAKYTRYAPSDLATGRDAFDHYQLGLAGFRLDRQPNAGSLLTLQGEGYTGREQQLFLEPSTNLVEPSTGQPFVTAVRGDLLVHGGHVLGRWTNTTAAGETMVQSYFDYTGRATPVFDDRRRTFDVEAQDRVSLASAQEITFGAGFRHNADHVRNTPYIALHPPEQRTELWNAFVQDDLTLVPQRLHAIVGTKLEHDPYSGVELQPGVRLLWTPSDQQTGWVSVARAVRTPSRADEDILLREVTPTPAVSVVVNGNRSLGAENLVAYEAGYRLRPYGKVSLDLALFYNDYTHLRTTEIEPVARGALPPALPAPIVLQSFAGDRMHGETHGGELSLQAQVLPAWRLRATYSFLRTNLHLDPGSTDQSAVAMAKRSPEHQATFWSQHDLGRQWQVDWRLRYVQRLEVLSIPAVFEGDVRVAWRPAPQWEFSLNGQNLFHRRHPEFVSSYVISPQTDVPRSVFALARYAY